jgi:phage gp29-like protein
MAKGIYINPTTLVPLNQVLQGLTSEVATRQFALGSYAGFFSYLPDPDPILRKLGADQTIYKDLLADDQAGPLYNRRKNLTKSLDWYVEPGDAGEREVELCEAALKTMEGNGCKVKDIIDQTLNPIGFGYSVFEINFQQVPLEKGGGLRSRTGDVWLPVSAWEKPREWFFFDNKNQLHFRTQLNSAEGIIIIGPEADPAVSIKFILLQNQPTYENPYGDKALSRCFWPVNFKRGGMKFFSVFIEKYGMPFLFGKLPRGAKPEDHNSLLEKLNDMIQDAVGTGPDDSSLQIIEPSGTRSSDLYDKYLQRCDNSISKALLGNALSTDIQQTGARASSETGAVTIEGDMAQTDRDFPTAFFNELFKRIVDINIGSGLYPTFTVKELDDAKTDFATRDKTLSEAFASGGQKIKYKKEFLINNYGYDEKEFELVDNPEPSFPTNPLLGGRQTPWSPTDSSRAGGGLQPGPEVRSQRSEVSGKKPEQNPELSRWKKFWSKLFRIEFQNSPSPGGGVGGWADSLPDKLLQFQMEEVMKPVFELAKKVNTREEFIYGLAALYPKMETRQLEDLAAKVFFIAEIEGRLDAQK